MMRSYVVHHHQTCLRSKTAGITCSQMPHEIDTIGAAVVKAVCNPEAKDFALDLAQFELGAFVEDGVLQEIPIIKSVIACRKTWLALQDQLFLRKVAAFCSNPLQFTPEQKEHFIQNHLNDDQQAKRLYDAIVLILDKLDDLEKPQMLSKVFAAFVRNEFGLDVFRRLATAIEIGFLDDLKEFVQPNAESPTPQNARRGNPKLRALHENLLRTGLVGIQTSSGTTAITGVGFVVTELGQIFKKCMNN